MPTWLLVTVLVVLVALRWGLNGLNSNVIDVGYAGVIGSDLILDGQTPYGNFPEDCGQCDTYGPLNYISYIPFEAVMPFTGKWDDLPAAHGAATLFDGLTLLALLVLGWRLAGRKMGLTFAIAWAARDAELRVVAAGARADERAVRELLALQSSDWAFMTHRELSAPYAHERVAGHREALETALSSVGSLGPAVRNLAPDASPAALLVP